MSNSLQDWLKSQLTRSKQNSQAWVDFTHALGLMINNHVDPVLNRLKSRNSIFEMDRQDIQVEIRELGDTFALGDVVESDIPMTLIQRKDQVHMKRTVYPLEATLNREFNGMEVTWQPLYAPVDQELHPYGSTLVTEKDLKGVIPDDYFLTSRGVIEVPLNKVSRALNNDEEAIRAFEEKLKRVIYPLIPLRIVMQGTRYSLTFELFEVLEWIVWGLSQVDTKLKPMLDKEGKSPNFFQTVLLDFFTEDKPHKFPKQQARTRLDLHHLDSLRLDRNYYVYEKVWRTFITNALESIQGNQSIVSQAFNTDEEQDETDYMLNVDAGTFTSEDKPRPPLQKQAKTRLDAIKLDSVRLDRNFFVYDELWRVTLIEICPQISSFLTQTTTSQVTVENNEYTTQSSAIGTQISTKETGLIGQAGFTSVRMDETPIDAVRLDRYVRI